MFASPHFRDRVARLRRAPSNRSRRCRRMADRAGQASSTWSSWSSQSDRRKASSTSSTYLASHSRSMALAWFLQQAITVGGLGTIYLAVPLAICIVALVMTFPRKDPRRIVGADILVRLATYHEPVRARMEARRPERRPGAVPPDRRRVHLAGSRRATVRGRIHDRQRVLCPCYVGAFNHGRYWRVVVIPGQNRCAAHWRIF